LMVRVQVSTFPTTIQLALLQVLLWLVGAGLMLGVTELKTADAPAGIAVAVMVKTWEWVITLVAWSGEMAMDPSTQLLAAEALSPVSPSPVVRVRVTPWTPTLVDAVMVVRPAVGEL